MKKFLVTLLAIGCLAILIVGYKHWKEKTFVAAEVEKQEIVIEPEETKVASETYLDLTGNWPTQAQENYQSAVEEGQAFTILLVGSTALGTGETAWSTMVKNELEQAYGETVHVSVKEYELTSKQFRSENKIDELLAEEPDLTLLEPFTLNDNSSSVPVSSSQKLIEEVDSSLAEQNPEHVLLLQPTNPLYNARNYPVQVDELAAYAEENDLVYLDHWTAWPDQEDEAMNDFLVTEGNHTYPNEKGHQVWAEFLIDYFISN